MKETLCHCGKPLHYSNKETERTMKMFASDLGEFIKVTIPGKGTWNVQRHYIALHGIKGANLGELGFTKL